MANRQKVLSVFVKAMAVFYVAFGLFLLVMPHLSFRIGGAAFVVEGASKLLLGIFLVGYGIYRCYVAFQKKRIDNDKLTVIAASILMLTSCNTNPNQGGRWSDNDTVNVCVDETFKPIMESGYDVFSSIDTLSEMFVEYVPENVAITKLINGEAQVAVASRQLTKEETAILNKKTIYPRIAKIATDAIAVITHKSNPDSVLSVNEIRQILTGGITNWNQIGKKQKNSTINVIFDNNESGIVRFMVDSICKGQKFNAKAYAMTINRDVVDYVAKHEDAIGFIGASWISDPNDTLHLSFHKKIQVLAICDGDDKESCDAYKPYQAYLLDRMYPFIRDIYMIDAEPKDGKGIRFINFMSGEKGQRIILKSGILPAIAPTRMIHVSNSL
jgi:phosphate transport system substrate-binding protein